MSRIFLFVATIAAMLTSGCASEFYRLELTPDEDGFQRQLTVWRRPSSSDESAENRAIDPQKLAHLARIYGEWETIDDGKKDVFTGHFSETMPADIGGHGTWIRYESPLGVVTHYSERFRGSDDLEQQLGHRRVFVDRAVNLTIDWLRSEMKDESDFARVEAFLHVTLRRDMKNAAFFALVHQLVQEPLLDRNQRDSGQRDGGQQELEHRLWQYLAERDYWRPADLPGWMIAVRTFDQHPQRLLQAVQRGLARKIGVADDQPVPPSIEFLADAPYVQQSLEAFLRQTDEYREAVENWRKEHPDQPESEAPPALAAVGGAILGPIVLGDQTITLEADLEVVLNSGSEPHRTNGQWNSAAGRVAWKHRLAGGPLPAFSYASWSEPNDAVQQARFGRILLADKQLAEYILWYNGLDAEDAKAWDGFIDSLTPDGPLRDRVQTFRFPAEQVDSAPISDIPRALLLEALDS